MSRGWYSVDFREAWEIETGIEMYGAGSGQVIDEVLHGEGADRIKRAIPSRIHPSGRKWNGKGKSIAGDPGAGSRLSQDDAPLQVTIAARGALRYLYFPDDGTDTVNHAGDQQFMREGAESEEQSIIDMCMDALYEKFMA